MTAPRDTRSREVASPWSPYGLRSDPYFQEPLTSDVAGSGDRPATLFVGRDPEILLLGRQIVGALSSRAVVEGSPGVGKTSFVNRLKATLTNPRRSETVVLSHTDPVRVTGIMTVHEFAAEVLRSLLQIHVTQHREHQAHGSKSEVAFWRRVGRILNGEDSVAGGVTLGPVGANRQLVRIAAEQRSLALYDEMAQAFAYLSRSGARRTMIHVNNLENLSRADAAHAAQLMQNLRDYFLIPHSHWIFVGAAGVDAQIFRRAPQVSSIIPPAVTLAPLAVDEVIELLTLRYRYVARGVRWIAPVAPDSVTALYRRYHGDLRNFLRLLSYAVQRAAVSDPAAPLTESTVLAALAATYHGALSAILQESDLAALQTLVAGQRADFTFRVADVHNQVAISQPAASRLVDRLAAAGTIEPDRTEGRSTYYRLAGNTGIAFGLP